LRNQGATPYLPAVVALRLSVKPHGLVQPRFLPVGNYSDPDLEALCCSKTPPAVVEAQKGFLLVFEIRVIDWPSFGSREIDGLRKIKLFHRDV
jgi:hypothetical protein